MARRSGWSRLSPAYRAQLQRWGNTRESWSSGRPIRRPRAPSEYERLSGAYRGRMRRMGVGREEYLAGYGPGRLPPVPGGARVHELAGRVLRGERLEGQALRDADRVRVGVPYLREASDELAVVLYDNLVDPTTGHVQRITPITNFSARPIDLEIEYDDGSTRTVQIPAQLFDDLYFWLDSFGPEGTDNDLGWSWEVSYG